MQIENIRDSKLKTISLIVFAGIFLGIARAYFLEYFIADVYPLNTFLYNPADRFNDLFNMIKICSQNSPYVNDFRFQSNYFPVANSIFYLFSFIHNNVLLIVLFLGIFLLVFGKILTKLFKVNLGPSSNLLNLLIIFFFSYPILFNIDRMNIEIYNFLLCLLWVYFKDKNRPWLAIFFLSLSISMKLYTGVFIILYLKDKKYKEVFIIGITVAIISVFSLFTLRGGSIENVQAMLTALAKFTKMYQGGAGMHFNLSIFGLIKVCYNILIIKLNVGNTFNIETILPIYTILSFIAFAGIVFIILKRNLPEWMNFFLLVSVLILFPHVSFDYKLIFVFLPLIYFLKDETRNRFDKFYMFGFGCLLIPHNYVYLHTDISIAVIIFPLIIISMSLFIILKNNMNVANQHNNSIL